MVRARKLKLYQIVLPLILPPCFSSLFFCLTSAVSLAQVLLDSRREAANKVNIGQRKKEKESCNLLQPPIPPKLS